MKMLKRKNLTLDDIRQTLQNHHDSIDVDDSDSESTGVPQKEILENLMTFLQGCS